MNCDNCGAPMTVMQKEAYFYCEYCGSFHFPQVSEQGITVLDQAQDLVCPVCRYALFRASIDGHRAYHCKNCRGILIRQFSFGKIIHIRRAQATAPSRSPQPIRKRELQRIVDCPSCQRPMSTHPYYGPGNIVIDTCAHCGVLWLDYGELGKVVDAPGRDRGDFLADLIEMLESDERDES